MLTAVSDTQAFKVHAASANKCDRAASVLEMVLFE